MKKAVITILMALPFVLIVIISVAGMILSEYTNISVEAVSFVDGDDNVISSVSIGKDDTYELNVQIYPRRATNRRVSFSSSNPDCVTVTDGVATGVDYGSSVITVTTSDGRKTATLMMQMPMSTGFLGPTESIHWPDRMAKSAGTKAKSAIITPTSKAVAFS